MKGQTYCTILVLGFLLICGEPQALAPYANYTGLPGRTYDLGHLTSADIITVNASWSKEWLSDQPFHPVIIFLFSINDTDGTVTQLYNTSDLLP